jgi:hypothetical protein
LSSLYPLDTSRSNPPSPVVTTKTVSRHSQMSVPLLSSTGIFIIFHIQCYEVLKRKIKGEERQNRRRHVQPLIEWEGNSSLKGHLSKEVTCVNPVDSMEENSRQGQQQEQRPWNTEYMLHDWRIVKNQYIGTEGIRKGLINKVREETRSKIFYCLIGHCKNFEYYFWIKIKNHRKVLREDW